MQITADVPIMIICGVIVLGVLIFIHEGGHYLASRLFGIRVTEFMFGLPGPSIGITRGETRFGITAVPLGGYARVCGMEPGEMKPHLKEVMASLYARGTANMEDVACDCGITPEAACEALDELVEWGSVCGPLRTDKYNTYRTPQVKPTKRQVERALKRGEPAPETFERGQARPLADPQAFFDAEYSRQYRSLPFWKRTVILVAGVAMNLLFAMIVFVIIYSVLGFDVQNTTTGEVTHMTVSPLLAIQAGFTYIGMVVQAVVSLFNPQTAAETVANSTSIMGIAVLSKSAFEAGLVTALQFMAMISVSLGVMNLMPIPPLDGGRFVIEVVQKITRRPVTPRILSTISTLGMALFFMFFIIMLNQDIQRFVFGS